MSPPSTERPRRWTRPRRLTVLGSQWLGPRVRRIRFGGADLDDFPAVSGGAHIKLFIPEPGQAPVLPEVGEHGPIWPAGERPATRTYSVRRFDAGSGALDVDFVLHGDGGPASRWASRARRGDELGLAGPNGPPLFRHEAAFHVLAGDLSALPALAATLERLPATARGVACIETPGEDDRQALDHPTGITLHWLQRQGATDSALPGMLRTLRWPVGRDEVSATVAGEDAAVVAIRHHLLHERGLSKSQVYAVPYWRAGDSEEQYHAERHRILDEVE